MPTYTYTLPANTYVQADNPSFNHTGIQLGADEKITSIKMNAKSSVRFKNLLSSAFMFDPEFVFYKANTYDSENLIARFTQGTYTRVEANATVTLNIAETSLSVTNNAKGYLLFLCAYAPVALLSGNTLQILDSLSFTITTEFEGLSKSLIKTQVYPSSTGTVTSVNDYYDVGDTINISATAGTGYVFDRWTANAGIFANSYSSSTVFTVTDSDATIFACFMASGSSEPNAGRYNGTGYDAVIPLRYNGTDWEECDLAYYNGTNWVNSDTL